MSTATPRPDTRPVTRSAPSGGLGQQLLAVAERAAQEAGRELVVRAGNPQRVSTKSTPTDLVSEADEAAETVIQHVILSARPADGLVGEEGARRESRSGITWVVDPLDGTVNYLFGDREWSVSIAAVDDYGPVAAAVLEPMSGQMWTAVRDHGAWRNGSRLSARQTPGVSDAMVLVGLSYDSTERRRQMEMFTEVAPSVRDLRRHGSAALELCRVAEGVADAYVESPIYRWDIEAGTLIAREAGADVHVARLDGVRRSIVATSASISRELLTLLRSSEFGAEAFDFVQEQQR